MWALWVNRANILGTKKQTQIENHFSHQLSEQKTIVNNTNLSTVHCAEC